MSASRRIVAGFIRLGLVGLAVLLVAGYFSRRVRHKEPVRVQREAPPPSETLGPGDMRIYNVDSTVDLVLAGNNILAGLSPKTVAKIKGKLDSSSARDTTGIGGSISRIVKQSVAGAIGTHAVFPLSEIRDIRYEKGEIVFDWKNGEENQIFGNTKVNGSKVSSSFRPDDAQRFVEAVRARMGLPGSR